MRISEQIKTYSNEAIDSSFGTNRPSAPASITTANDIYTEKTSQIPDSTFGKDNFTLNNTDKLITRQERDFFIDMFPENSEKLDKHILFNRNGKIQTQNLQLGTIVDETV